MLTRKNHRVLGLGEIALFFFQQITAQIRVAGGSLFSGAVEELKDVQTWLVMAFLGFACTGMSTAANVLQYGIGLMN